METTPPNRSLMIVLSYLWVLALIPLWLERDDAELRWHAKHGIVLMMAEVVLLCLFGTLLTVVSPATFGMGAVVMILGIATYVAVLGIHLVAMIMGINGGRLVIPRISLMANRF